MKNCLGFVLSVMLAVICVRAEPAPGTSREISPAEVRRPDLTISNSTPISAIALSADGKILATGDKNEIRIYDTLAGGQGPAHLSQTLKETAPVLALCFHGTNALLSLARDGTIKRSSLEWGGLHQSAKISFGEQFIPVISPANERFIAGASLRQVWLYDDDTGKRLRDFKVNDSDVAAMAFTPDGKLLVIGSVKGVVRVLDVAAWKVTRMIDLDTPIYSIAASEKHIAVGYGDGSVGVLNFGDQDSVPEVDGQTGQIEALAFSPGGDLFASGSADGSIKIWESRTLKLVGSLKGNSGGVRSILFSPDGRWVVSRDANGSVNIWTAPK